MQVLSLNVGMPRTIDYKGSSITTGIFKSAVEGPRMARATGMEGDGQADLTVHGGEAKAVYAFPRENYRFYEQRFGPEPFGFGYLGENLTTEGLLERDVRIGDRFRIGGALMEVSQPRSPCNKFAMKLGSPHAVKVCIVSAKTGFYLRVLEEGPVAAGDRIEREYSEDGAPSVEETHLLYYVDIDNVAGIKRALACPALADVWRRDFQARLEKLTGAKG